MSKLALCTDHQTGTDVQMAAESQHCTAAEDTAASQTTIDDDDMLHYNEAGLT